MKLAIAGKGGVGKTTLSSILARIYSAEGKSVIAIDANPDTNLAAAIGIPASEAEKLLPIAELKELISERTGAKPGSYGSYFKINPKVDDIPEKFSIKKDNIKLLVMGRVKTGGMGCMCPESAVLRSLLAHLLISRSDIVIMDMDAGIEHLGRGTAAAVDAFIVVVEPGKRSFQTAESVKKLASDLGIRRVFVVGNKLRSKQDENFIRQNLIGFEVLGFMTYNPAITEADIKGVSPYDLSPDTVSEVKLIKGNLDILCSRKGS